MTLCLRDDSCVIIQGIFGKNGAAFNISGTGDEIHDTYTYYFAAGQIAFDLSAITKLVNLTLAY